MKIAVIFANVEYTDLPFGHLYQLDRVGISNIIILLNEDEFEKAHTTRIRVFDYTLPQTVIEHYQSQSDRLQIEIINTGRATTEEEKLDFYLKHAEGQYKLNLFLCKGAIYAVNEEIRAKPLIRETTEYIHIPFFKSTKRKKVPFFQSPCSSDQTIELLQHELNTCFCYQMSPFDVMHYQWLFNIFVELINLKIKLREGNNAEFLSQLNKIINNFNKTILHFEKAETAFEKTNKKAYNKFDKPDLILRLRHEKHVKKKERLEDNFPKLVSKLVKLYEKLTSLENLNQLKEKDEIIGEDFIQPIETKQFAK
ncbi:hypothetical protein OQJ26_12835 [Legionella sp. PATHC038]|uniref:hypothetical protein n=1 Tax=Legionella sheltonii TaxID=2992041 RepID=UPI00224362FA|nr:hypothetical protein [Legionella sp. PATHC038]MCW8399677.1 hypothetical protein [Legionella sp. PATHC038]